MLRVKNGAWAPLRFSSMLSFPATGMTLMLVTRGDDGLTSGDNFWLHCTNEIIAECSNSRTDAPPVRSSGMRARPSWRLPPGSDCFMSSEQAA